MFKKIKKIIFPIAKFAFDKYTSKQRSYVQEINSFFIYNNLIYQL